MIRCKGCEFSLSALKRHTNLLLTEHEGCTGEYWHEVLTAGADRAKTTEGQYSPVWLEQTRLVLSSLLLAVFAKA